MVLLGETLTDSSGTVSTADPGVPLPLPVDDSDVVLLDSSGRPIGRQRKSEVHHSSTPLHLAFSLYVFDLQGRVLMTRRALDKRTWPGVWTNSCCGHPTPDESAEDAISRRLRGELNIAVTELECVLPSFAYRAQDASGVWENEICPVYFGTVENPIDLQPAPGEVMEYHWSDWDDLASATRMAPYAFSPWSVLQIAELSRPL